MSASSFPGFILAALVLTVITNPSYAEQNSTSLINIEEDGTITVPSFKLPFSHFMGQDSVGIFRRQMLRWDDIVKGCRDKHFSRAGCSEKYMSVLIAKHKSRYEVVVQPRTINGVHVQFITPGEGLSSKNRKRILVNIPAGGPDVGQVEAIPVAATGKITVVSVDVNLTAESKFPVASQRIGQVYKALLKDYEPKNIGIYGCSKGGILTSQFLAWAQKEGLPGLGAAGLFCIGAAKLVGDSVYYGAAFENHTPMLKLKASYFDNVDDNDPLKFPANSQQVIAKFPPVLLLSSTRDFMLSSSVYTHRQLVKQGIETELHLWDGLRHGFFSDSDFPESREAYDVIYRFFNKHLGKQGL